jgi:hypothetical protein
VTSGAVDKEQANELLKRATAVFIASSAAQVDVIRAEKPERIFFQTLAGLVSAGAVDFRPLGKINHQDGKRPDIGGWGDKYVYLEYQSAFEQVCESLRRMGGSFPLTLNGLKRRLVEDGSVRRGEGQNIMRKVPGGIRRMLWIHAAACPELMEVVTSWQERQTSEGNATTLEGEASTVA